MIITGMKQFESVCQKKLVEWYNKNIPETPIDLGDVFIVWSCKTLQNYKCLAATTVSGDGIYAEYTFNGDKQELYEDVYKKITNICHTEEQEGGDSSISPFKTRGYVSYFCAIKYGLASGKVKRTINGKEKI